MFSSISFDVTLIWAGIIAFAVFMYVMLDGFDLGLGILFPFARRDEDRDLMMNSAAPIWDGNETWLVLGGRAMFGAFPLAYAVLLPAFYLPLILMLLGLIFRGVAFECRFKSSPPTGTGGTGRSPAAPTPPPSRRAWCWARSSRGSRWSTGASAATPSPG
jgi:cytochrome bd-type quinol oxidase subunit 2